MQPMWLSIHPNILHKLQAKHQVSARDVELAFINRTGGVLQDTREEHATDPATMWFISRTNTGRALKVVYVRVGDIIHIKTCYEPNAQEHRVFDSHPSQGTEP